MLDEHLCKVTPAMQTCPGKHTSMLCGAPMSRGAHAPRTCGAASECVVLAERCVGPLIVVANAGRRDVADATLNLRLAWRTGCTD